MSTSGAMPAYRPFERAPLPADDAGAHACRGRSCRPACGRRSRNPCRRECGSAADPGCGAIPESMIATEMPLRDTLTGRRRAADAAICAPRCRAPAWASTRTPASSETLRGAGNLAAERCGGAEDDQRGTRFGIDGANRCAAIEEPVERRVTFRGRRKLHDHARRLAGGHRGSTASSALSALLAATDGAIARTLIASDDGERPPGLPNKLHAVFPESELRHTTSLKLTSNDLQ